MPVSGSIAWSDDFNDGNYDGWTITGFYGPVVGDWGETAGKADIVNDELWFTGNQIFRNFSYAIHESSVAYGNWSFDVKVKPIYNSSNHTHIYFIDPRPPDDLPKISSTFSGYDILIYSAPWTIDVPDWMKPADDTAPSFLLVERPGVSILGTYSVDEINGSYHFDVTRDETGRFKVYINGTLRIEAVDNTYTTAQSFYLTSESGIGYDNIVVRDDVIIPEEPTTTSETPTPTESGFDLVLLGGISVGAAIVVVAAVFILKRRN